MTEPEAPRCPVCGHIDEGEPQCTVCGTAILRQQASKPAGFWIRLPAFVVDGIILQMISMVVTVVGLFVWSWGAGGAVSLPDSPDRVFEAYASISGLIAFFMFAVNAAYYTLFHAGPGQTPGKMLMKIRVVRADDCGLSYGAALIRWIGYFVNTLFFFLGFLWVGLSRSKRGWHDYLAGSKVIRIEVARDRAE